MFFRFWKGLGNSIVIYVGTVARLVALLYLPLSLCSHVCCVVVDVSAEGICVDQVKIYLPWFVLTVIIYCFLSRYIPLSDVP